MWEALELVAEDGQPVSDSLDVPDGDVPMRISVHNSNAAPIPIDAVETSIVTSLLAH